MSVSLRLAAGPLGPLTPPSHVGLRKLDKSLFVVKRTVWALLLTDLRSLGAFLGSKKSAGVALKLPCMPAVVEYSEKDLSSDEKEALSANPKYKALLIDPSLSSATSETFRLTEAVPSALRDTLAASNHFAKPYEITFDYTYWSHEDILKAVLPAELHANCPTSFTIAGHLAHLNLKAEYMPYRNIIGEIILSKYPNIKTVVHKTNNITSKFRTFEMEVLAGEDNFVVTQKESGCKFTFDFSKVYWNSRLATEHERLIDLFVPGEAVCDVMAGVGPFVVPAAKKGVVLFANDLNPESYRYLLQNTKDNKVDDYVHPYNMDGADFIQKSPKLLLDYHKATPEMHKFVQKGKKRVKVTVQTPSFFSHYVMNLPDSAINFVQYYVSLFSRAFPNLSQAEVEALPGFRLPIVNVHHFEKYKEEEIEGDLQTELHSRIHAKIVKGLAFDIAPSAISYHIVRQVAPCKLMYCVSFTLPAEVAFRPCVTL